MHALSLLVAVGLAESRWSMNVPRVLEEVVRAHLDQVGSTIPDVLAVIDDADKIVPTWE